MFPTVATLPGDWLPCVETNTGVPSGSSTAVCVRCLIIIFFVFVAVCAVCLAL